MIRTMTEADWFLCLYAANDDPLPKMLALAGWSDSWNTMWLSSPVAP